MYVVFSEKDVVIHETTTGDTTWRLASDCEDDDIFMAVWRKPTYPEGQWVIYWRGLWDKVRDRYEEVVLDMHLEEVGLWEGMPKGQDEALARAGEPFKNAVT